MNLDDLIREIMSLTPERIEELTEKSKVDLEKGWVWVEEAKQIPVDEHRDIEGPLQLVAADVVGKGLGIDPLKQFGPDVLFSMVGLIHTATIKAHEKGRREAVASMVFGQWNPDTESKN